MTRRPPNSILTLAIALSIALLSGCVGSERAKYLRHLGTLVQPVNATEQTPSGVAAGAFNDRADTDTADADTEDPDEVRVDGELSDRRSAAAHPGAAILRPE